jgi:ketosteroid isomerase-like protein
MNRLLVSTMFVLLAAAGSAAAGGAARTQAQAAEPARQDAPPVAPPPAPSAAEQELVQLERTWDAAFVAKDVRFIERVLADEFVATYGDGTLGDKARELAQTLDFDQQVDSAVMDDFRVRVYGETAVVWFTRRMTGPKGGKTIAIAYRFVDVFVRRAGRWQCVSSQSTKIAS